MRPYSLGGRPVVRRWTISTVWFEDIKGPPQLVYIRQMNRRRKRLLFSGWTQQQAKAHIWKTPAAAREWRRRHSAELANSLIAWTAKIPRCMKIYTAGGAA